MAFKVVTIADRISQYPDRRRLTKADGSSELVTVAAEEGSVSTEGTEWGAAYANDLETRIDAETHLLEGNFGTVETTTTASKAYAVGQCLTLNGQLYKVIAAISQGATLVVGTNIAVHSVSEINSNLGTLSFAKNADGKWGYKVAGADPVIPFSAFPKSLTGKYMPTIAHAEGATFSYTYTATADCTIMGILTVTQPSDRTDSYAFSDGAISTTAAKSCKINTATPIDSNIKSKQCICIAEMKVGNTMTFWQPYSVSWAAPSLNIVQLNL